LAKSTIGLEDEGFTLLDWYAPKVLERFSNANALKGLIEGVSASRQEVLAALSQIGKGFSVLNAKGAQLDILGYKFQVFREGENDEKFRARIIAVGGVKLSGTVNQIILILKVLGYGTIGVKSGRIEIRPLWVTDTEPAAFLVLLEDPLNLGAPPQSYLESIAPAGVAVNVGQWLALNEPEPEGEFIILNDDTPGDNEGTPILVI
jgi:hypothetical protein